MRRYNRADDIKELADDLGIGLQDIKILYAKYFEEMGIEILRIQQYILKQDWVMLERVIHNIKGVSASLNINDVYQKAAEFDSMLKNNKAENANSYANELIDLIKSAKEDVWEVLYL